MLVPMIALVAIGATGLGALWLRSHWSNANADQPTERTASSDSSSTDDLARTDPDLENSTPQATEDDLPPSQQIPIPDSSDSSDSEVEPFGEPSRSSRPEQPSSNQPSRHTTLDNDDPIARSDNRSDNAQTTPTFGNPSAVPTIPGFPIGTAQPLVEQRLGQPVDTGQGTLPNTTYARYDLQPNRISLTYTYDRDRTVRQTEATIGRRVDRLVVNVALNGMIDGGLTQDIEQGVAAVRDGDSERYTFNQGTIQGMVERNGRDRIYIRVWDSTAD